MEVIETKGEGAMNHSGKANYWTFHHRPHGPLTETELRIGERQDALKRQKTISELAAIDEQLRALRREAKELHYTRDVSNVAPAALKALAGERLDEVQAMTRQWETRRRDVVRRLQ